MSLRAARKILDEAMEHLLALKAGSIVCLCCARGVICPTAQDIERRFHKEMMSTRIVQRSPRRRKHYEQILRRATSAEHHR
jgi:hypothetical protein